ncbi:hypothetical protein MUG91_G176n2 [Manis pentadactyla]|nr:hypothetical protein MUG91_G176n2 [Manis pentadactyla]
MRAGRRLSGERKARTLARDRAPCSGGGRRDAPAGTASLEPPAPWTDRRVPAGKLRSGPPLAASTLVQEQQKMNDSQVTSPMCVRLPFVW